VSLLAVDDLTVAFSTLRARLTVLEGVRFTIGRGEILGVVGESGSGKSVTALAIMRLLGDQGAIERGRVVLDDVALTDLDDAAMLKVRGGEVAMIFQEPMTSLNPVFTVGFQIAEVLTEHLGMPRAQAMKRAAELMDEVGIPAAAQRLNDYPHQLSGGMRQRVMIAMALSCDPKVLIADEPTTALDVTIQAQILDLMRELQAKTGAAIMLITHDMGVIAENAHRVVVMYAGRKVEEAPVGDLFRAPRHPYTLGLLASIPRLDVAATATGDQRLKEIPGMVPALLDLPPGCAFAPRCAYATERCRREAPPLEAKRPGHWAACWESRSAPNAWQPMSRRASPRSRRCWRGCPRRPGRGSTWRAARPGWRPVCRARSTPRSSSAWVPSTSPAIPAAPGAASSRCRSSRWWSGIPTRSLPGIRSSTMRCGMISIGRASMRCAPAASFSARPRRSAGSTGRRRSIG